LDSLDKMIILDDVLPFLTDIQCSDVDIIMSIVGQLCTFDLQVTLSFTKTVTSRVMRMHVHFLDPTRSNLTQVDLYSTRLSS